MGPLRRRVWPALGATSRVGPGQYPAWESASRDHHRPSPEPPRQSPPRARTRRPQCHAICLYSRRGSASPP
jgi:hypothetical protein